MDLKTFFVTFLKLFNSRSSTFLEWSNCNTKFYKDAKQNFTKNSKTITVHKTKFEKPQRSRVKPKLLKTTKPQNPVTQFKLGHISFFFSFRVGALLNKSDFFASKLRVQKLFSYIIRGTVIHM